MALMVYQRRPRLNRHISWEIWYEILSRLPAKYLFVCSSVCKSWFRITKYLRRKRILALPLCGLVLKDCYNSIYQLEELEPLDDENANLTTTTYLSLGSKETLSWQTSPNNNLAHNNNDDDDADDMINSGYDNGLAADLVFDFGVLSSLEPTSLFSIHRGLILVDRDDGSYQVHNPATKLVFVVPKSPMMEEYGTHLEWGGEGEWEWERRASFLINIHPPASRFCIFWILRFWRAYREIEIYSSRKKEWTRWSFTDLSDELLTARWCWENYVVLKDTHTLFFLTDKDQGVAVDLVSHGVDYKLRILRVYGFPLPKIVEGGFENARLGECGGCLHLSYYNSGGMWIWKHINNSITNVNGDAWVWIPLIEISSTKPLCKNPVLVQDRLCKLLKDGDSIVPMAFHPDIDVVFLCINSFILAYDFAKETAEKIVKVSGLKYQISTIFALPYSPCLSPLFTPKPHRKVRK